VREESRLRKLAWILGLPIGLYLIARAIAEPFLIDFGDPATYRADWGGPSLFGVLAVHCGPGLVAAAAFAMALVRRRTSSPAGSRT